MSKPKNVISIDSASVIRVINILMLYIGSIALVWLFREALVMIGVAFFLALALNPPVSFIAKRIPGGSRGLATMIAFLLVVGAISALVLATIPTLVSESIEFVDALPETIDELREGDGMIADFLNRTNAAESAEASLAEYADRLADISGPIFSSLGALGSRVITLFTVLVMTAFMLMEGPKRIDAMWRIYPDEHRAHHQELANKMYSVVTGYVGGQLIIALVSACASYITMKIVGVPYALPLATIVGVLGLIPMIGATIAAVIVVLVSLTQNITAAVIMSVFYIIYQQIENNAIQPYIQAKTVDVSPLIVLVAVIAGYSVAGILGTLLAIPVAGCLRVLSLDAYETQAKKRGLKPLKIKKSTK